MSRENGYGRSMTEYEADDETPFRLEALAGDMEMREQARITPFADLESPFVGELEDEEPEYEDQELEDGEDRCPHCGRELELQLEDTASMHGRWDGETADERESPFLGEDYEDESPFEAAEAFDETSYGDAEWEEEELEHVDRLFEAEAELASLSPSELKAVRITSTFETGHAGGFGGLTGNFDGQGLSFGLMNWTIKAGSLIPMLQEFITKHGDRYAKIFGSDADRFKAMVFATRRDDSGHKVRDVAAQMDFVRGKMNDAAQKHIVEPWKTYFGGLENDPEFRAIEVGAARRGLAHAKRWFDRFGWKSERGFVFMFDLVSSHGAYWLDAKKFHGRREKLLAERTAQKKAELGHDPNELEMMELLANLIADVSLERWREKVRRRKLWFVHGKGKVHGTAYDLAKDFGVTDRAADFSAGSTAAAPSSSNGGGSSMFDVFGDAAKRIGQVVKSVDEIAAVRLAIANGETDETKLTSKVFFARHPELGGRRIRKDEHDLVEEWKDIRATIVRPALAKTSGVTKPATSKPTTTSTATGSLVLGLDTASVAGNKNVDWVKANTDAKMVFAIIRSNWGTSPDSTYSRDWNKIKAAGIVRGPYLFLRFPHPKHKHCPSPEAQAKAMIKKVGQLDESDFPPSLDVEFPGGRAATKMTAKQLLEGVREAWNVLKDFYKVAPIIYTSGRVWHEDLKDLPAPDLIESPLWLARYPYKKGKAVLHPKAKAPPIPKPWGDATNWWIHQYQGDATGLPGFPSGNVDLNRFHMMTAGESGDRVKWVQRRLGITESGTFDAAMEKALRAFKARKGLPSDAVIDPATFAYLCWA